jgi:FixJ family two-component response regulator/anti-sigma regulatory factor (Ser/Thr protein kinase)
MSANSKLHQVLIVEDDLYGLRFLESSLRLAGFSILSARSYESACELIQEQGFSSFAAVLTDYRLPKKTGLELLRWIRGGDPSLATVIITGQGEKSIVEGSLELGAFRYLEKPVTHQTLKGVMLEAADQTRRSRQSLSDRKGLEDLEQLDQALNGTVPESLKERVQLYYRPLHEVGGDFFIAHETLGRGTLLLLGDVSGHDIRSGFVSTYFQGMFRGCVESGSTVKAFIDLFNRTLLAQSRGTVDENRISLSLAAFELNPGDDHISHWNYGMPPCVAVGSDGRLHFSKGGNFPLGWVSELNLQPLSIPLASIDRLFIFTDGLHELATDLKVNPMSVLFRLIQAEKGTNTLLFEPSDDFLVVQYSIHNQRPLNAIYEPIISEHYAGTEVEHIDHLQSNWRRSLVFALEDRLGDRLYDLLICIREGMINALTHGCERSPEKFAHLQICLDADRENLRVVIDDPGRGHQFNLQRTLEGINRHESKHLGLGIIQHLSDEFAIENSGTSLVFDFEVKPEPPLKRTSA